MRSRRGVTLVELMVAMSLLTVGVLAFFSSFRYITRSIHVSRTRTLATNLAQERVEALKNMSYYQLLITTVSAVDATVSPAITYDTTNYPPETIKIGGITFTRYTFVALAQIDANVISTVTFTYPDTGMKQITSHIVWDDLGSKKKWTLTNLLENPNVNPLDATIYGTVTKQAGGGNLQGAIIRIDQNPDWNDNTDAAGYYQFRVYHGSYTVRASSAGYYDAESSAVSVTGGSSVSVPLVMQAIGSGTVQGIAWKVPTNLLITQVVVSSAQLDSNNFQLQYVEIYNPTAFPIAIASAGTPIIKLNFQKATGCSNPTVCTDVTTGIKMTYIAETVLPGHYYVFANTTTFTVAGTSVTADAVFTDDADTNCSTPPPALLWNLVAVPPLKKIAENGHGGTFWLTDATNTILDGFGWTHAIQSAPNYMGAPVTVNTGFPIGQQMVRVSSPGASAADMVNYAHSYNASNNSTDFLYTPALVTIQYPPQPSTMSYTGPPVITGVPAVGALISAGDPYSGSTVAWTAYITSGALSVPYARYGLQGVTTGTWSIVLATGAYSAEIGTVTITQGLTFPVPNATSSPAWTLTGYPSLFVNNSSPSGFVSGRVSDPNNAPLSGITVLAGGNSKVTGTNGAFFVAVATGTVPVIANPNNSNQSYVQQIAMPTVNSGVIVNQDFSLALGGIVSGYLTSGTSPLPNFTVVALVGGNQMATGASNTSGIFILRNLSTGTYTIQPTLDPGQDSSPNSIVTTVSSTGTVFIGTFTVSGSFGNIVGTVTDTATSQLVTSGALILASTSTIAANPPSIYGSSAPALSPMYAISSKADGTYILPVRGNSTYYVSVYVPTIANNGSVSVTTKTYSTIFVSPSLSTTRNITLP